MQAVKSAEKKPPTEVESADNVTSKSHREKAESELSELGETEKTYLITILHNVAPSASPQLGLLHLLSPKTS